MTRESGNKPEKGKAFAPAKRRARGFVQTGGLLNGRFEAAGNKRGFAEMRLLTHWDEIVGPMLAGLARPVKITHPRDGFGATLTVMANGARAPEVQMMLPDLKQKINAVYGYNAIARIRLTQNASHGFAEPATSFQHAPKPALSPQKRAELQDTIAPVSDEGLRAALERLGQNVLNRQSPL